MAKLINMPRVMKVVLLGIILKDLVGMRNYIMVV
jgi:hypothetical protein